MKTPDELKQFYATDLVNDLKAIDKKRLTALFWVAVATALSAFACLSCGAISYAAETPVIICIGFAVLLLAWLVACYFATRGYKAEFKDQIIRKLVTFLDPALTYAKEGCIAPDVYTRSQIFLTRYDRYSGEDYVTGTLGRTQVAFSELHTQYKTEYTDSKGHHHTQWHTIFRGIFFVADFNKNFNGVTVVLTDTAEKLFGFLGRKLQAMNPRRGELIKLEDPEFEQQFVVYGDDQIGARYILSTALMKRMTEFRQRTKKEVQFSFVANQVMIAISYPKDLFEPALFTTLVTFAPIQEYYNDLCLALGIVEELNLNTRIWSKQ